ncbi:hypothetical protein CEE69_30510 [Rhodopirellula bahusiensis]|uniref:Uncharacterized protein n=1 Tax=Rhodopirellula bahusiensis TaxID=2014065 RepID=A0A2G1VXP7_9BACT|nr:hypothetical protein CEE69_30510 [Rhodopirellula bahusiensis]
MTRPTTETMSNPKVSNGATKRTRTIESRSASDFSRSVGKILTLARATEGFYATAVAMPFKFEQRKILPPVGGLNKRQRCAEGLSVKTMLSGTSGGVQFAICEEFHHLRDHRTNDDHLVGRRR